MTSLRQARAVTFDFGQTLAELDHEFLAQRAKDLGAELDPVAARAATVTAWSAYGAAKARGHARAWQAMMLEVLRGAGVRPSSGAASPGFAEAVAESLWQAQPVKNLWRKPIPGMFELAAELTGSGVPVGIITGTYSSIYIASAIVLWWHKGERPNIGASQDTVQNAPTAKV